MPKGVKYGFGEEENMERALDALRNVDLGLNAVARTYSIREATPKRRNYYALGHKKKFGGLRDIREEIEEELKNHILKLEERLFGITPLELRSLAYQVAERNCVAHRFNKDKKIAGKKWYYALMKR